MVVGILLLIFGGFVIVANLAGTQKSPPVKPLSAQPTATSPPSASVSPQLPVNKTSQTEGQWRSDLSQAQSLLDQLIADVSGNDWAAAQTHFTEFNGKTQRMPTPQLNHPDISPVMQDFFALYKIQLARALSEQNHQQARFSINQLFGIVGEQRARFSARGVPLEFQRLRFLLREVEIWSGAGDAEMLAMRKTALGDAWKDMRPIIAARRSGAEQVAHFDQLVEKLLVTGQPTELSLLLPEFGQEMDKMNNLFQRQPRTAGSPSMTTKALEED
ncbi:MAG TPA: hypothetical protein PLD20_16950 [Blastocatellia bacterium]|nr:hypothetical protein [Blastocatellia bacterium]HMX30202.1 hypothetical protein [Blastocatellia bacterium]HMZ19626.1 hypothetical protein [Blastocatellia bacterium]HNG32798.1 hypothetical protein [Blastocatellia bacterium]